MPAINCPCRSKGNSRGGFIALLASVALLAAALLGCARLPEYAGPPISGDAVVIDADTLIKGVPVFFTYRGDGKPINFFVFRIDGQVHSYFDACEKCYPDKRGYRFQDGLLICGACNEKFSLRQLDKGAGTCIPIKLEGTLSDGRYTIGLRSIKARSGVF